MSPKSSALCRLLDGVAKMLLPSSNLAYNLASNLELS